MLVRLARGIRPIINDDAPNGYIIVLQRLPGFPDRQIHIVFIALRACCRNRHCFHPVCSSFQISVRLKLTVMDLHVHVVLTLHLLLVPLNQNPNRLDRRADRLIGVMLDLVT